MEQKREALHSASLTTVTNRRMKRVCHVALQAAAAETAVSATFRISLVLPSVWGTWNQQLKWQ